MKKIPAGWYGFAREVCANTWLLVDDNYICFQILQKE